MGKRKLMRSPAKRASHESPGEDCGRPHQTVGVNQWFPVWLCPRQRHNRCHLCCQAAASEVLAANKRLYMAFVDLEKEFDWVPQKVTWWALRKLDVEEWIVWLVQGMYMPMSGAMSMLVRSTEKCLKWRSVFTKVQYSACYSSSLCLKPCLVSSALGSPGRTSMQMTLLSSLNHLKNVSGGSWLGKKQWRRKDWVNAGKKKIMICGMGLDPLQSSVEFTWAVCRSGVGSNIFCNDCKHWVHKKCIGLKHLAKDPDCRCTRCQETAYPLEGRQHRKVQVETDKL